MEDLNILKKIVGSLELTGDIFRLALVLSINAKKRTKRKFPKYV